MIVSPKKDAEVMRNSLWRLRNALAALQLGEPVRIFYRVLIWNVQLSWLDTVANEKLAGRKI